MLKCLHYICLRYILWTFLHHCVQLTQKVEHCFMVKRWGRHVTYYALKYWRVVHKTMRRPCKQSFFQNSNFFPVFSLYCTWFHLRMHLLWVEHQNMLGYLSTAPTYLILMTGYFQLTRVAFVMKSHKCFVLSGSLLESQNSENNSK